MQSTCPQSFLPLVQLGMCTTLEHKYDCQDLVVMMNKFGFCLSYTEASKYMKNAVFLQGVDMV